VVGEAQLRGPAEDQPPWPLRGEGGVVLDSEVVGQLERTLEEREEELTAAREAHRRLMAEHNRVTARTR
jgi:hypothetical protein